MSDVEAAYARRAGEYIELLGSIDAAHPSDRQLIKSRAAQAEGLLLDAGCGPGHWAAYLAGCGVDARGIDRVPAFIDHARRVHPGVRFDVGDIDALQDAPHSLGAVLAWYSLIHHGPDLLPQTLAEFARVLRPGGGLLVGFFTGATIESFEHAVTTAYRWPPDELAQQLEAAGFDVVETHTRTAAAPRPRPHGAIVARRR